MMTTADTLLASLQSHLSAQTAHLPRLHERLGLPTSALEDELENLKEKLIEAVEQQVEIRRKEVADWVTKCESVEAQWTQYIVHLGGFVKERDKHGPSLDDIRRETILPRRYEQGRKAGERVKQLYQSKLDTLKTLQGRLRSLAHVLGDTFFPLEILHAKDDTELIDVTPERFARIEKELARGKGEVNNRLNALANAFCQIEWLYAELGLSPDDTTFSGSRSTSPMEDEDPFAVMTPTPPSRSSSSSAILLPSFSSPSSEIKAYRHVLTAFITHLQANPSASEADHLRFLASVEPTVDFLEWADTLLSSLNTEKERREARIQTLYDQLEPIWVRLGITSEDIDAFVEHHRGTSNTALDAYEAELERMMELKKERMVEFVDAARAEVERLHEELLDPTEDEDPYSYSDNDEDVLSLLEERIVQLKAELKAKNAGGLLGMVKKYFTICEEESELAASAQDQGRLLGRGRDAGRLLREEKMRKRVKKEKPKIQNDLLTALPAWEARYQKPFLVHGESMFEILSSAQEAQEAAVVTGTKRKAPPGSGPGVQHSRGITPTPAPVPGGSRSRGVTPTPVPASSRTRGVTPSSTMKTPIARSTSHATNGTGTKRMKMGTGDYVTNSTSSISQVPFANASNRPPLSSSTSSSKFGFQRTVSIPVPKPGTAHHVLGHGRLPTAATLTFGAGGAVRNFSSSIVGGYKKRESFRPRPSLERRSGEESGLEV
ncbi:microtubule associated protein-domain-containing protein [Flagelloscypha sp. PMI_526]|nr:microtubule associated protein-domain-containing protein [Flagelloscypha sp. PMI_526]